jgi:hypothetical protein
MMKSPNGIEHEGHGASLSETALVILSGAAGREDGMVLPLPNSVRLHGGARNKLLRKLLRQELMEEVHAADPEHAGWITDDGSRAGLKISAKGLRAIGLEGEAPDGDGRSESGAKVEAEPPTLADDAQVSQAHVGARASISSDAENANGTAGVLVRPGSKQALLVDHLSSGEGCTLDELVKLLGWQRHTVRAALTGLRRKGFRIAKSKSPEGETRYQAFSWPDRPS